MNLFKEQQYEFAGRHIGPNEQEAKEMLQSIGIDTLD
jgi:glycine dehydrogenase